MSLSENKGRKSAVIATPSAFISLFITFCLTHSLSHKMIRYNHRHVVTNSVLLFDVEKS